MLTIMAMIIMHVCVMDYNAYRTCRIKSLQYIAQYQTSQGVQVVVPPNPKLEEKMAVQPEGAYIHIYSTN